MHKISKKEGPLQLADLILKSNPDASIEMMTDIISDWGDLFDDQRFAASGPNDIQGAASNGEQQLDS
jgi:hypothetical protein